VVGSTTRKRQAAELERLKTRANDARVRMDGTVTRVRAEIRDPYGIRTTITSHPYVTAGVATGLGVAMARLLSGRKPRSEGAPTRLDYWVGMLMTGGIAALKPLGRLYLAKWIAQFGPESTPAPDGAAASAPSA